MALPLSRTRRGEAGAMVLVNYESRDAKWSCAAVGSPAESVCSECIEADNHEARIPSIRRARVVPGLPRVAPVTITGNDGHYPIVLSS